MFKDLTLLPGNTQKEKALQAFSRHPISDMFKGLIIAVIGGLVITWVLNNYIHGFNEALMSMVYGKGHSIRFDDSIIDEIGSVIGFIIWSVTILTGFAAIAHFIGSVLLGGAFRWNRIVSAINDGKITPSVIGGNDATSNLVMLDEENRLISYAGREPFSLEKILDWSHEQYVETSTYLAQGGGAVNSTKREYFLNLNWEDENGNLQAIKVKFGNKATEVEQFLHRMNKAHAAGVA